MDGAEKAVEAAAVNIIVCVAAVGGTWKCPVARRRKLGKFLLAAPPKSPPSRK
jgi:hypothetical protein